MTKKKAKYRTFNTAGLCFPEKHYMVEPLKRLQEVEVLIDEELYFAIHAPRQTGKEEREKRIVQDIINGKRNSPGKKRFITIKPSSW